MPWSHTLVCKWFGSWSLEPMGLSWMNLMSGISNTWSNQNVMQFVSSHQSKIGLFRNPLLQQDSQNRIGQVCCLLYVTTHVRIHRISWTRGLVQKPTGIRSNQPQADLGRHGILPEKLTFNEFQCKPVHLERNYTFPVAIKCHCNRIS